MTAEYAATRSPQITQDKVGTSDFCEAVVMSPLGGRPVTPHDVRVGRCALAPPGPEDGRRDPPNVNHESKQHRIKLSTCTWSNRLGWAGGTTNGFDRSEGYTSRAIAHVATLKRATKHAVMRSPQITHVEMFTAHLFVLF